MKPTSPLHGNQNSTAINEGKSKYEIKNKNQEVEGERSEVLTRHHILCVSVYLNKIWVSSLLGPLHWQQSSEGCQKSNETIASSPLDSPTTLQDLHCSLLDEHRAMRLSKTPTLLPPRLLFGYHHDPTYTLITSSSHSSSTSHKSALLVILSLHSFIVSPCQTVK